MEDSHKRTFLCNLNNTDWAIIHCVGQKDYTVGELQRKIPIAPVNVWKRLQKLKEADIVHMPDAKKGEKKILTLTDKGKKFYYFSKILFDIRRSR